MYTSIIFLFDCSTLTSVVIPGLIKKPPPLAPISLKSFNRFPLLSLSHTSKKLDHPAGE
ncbi:MAG: hypothetical protein QXE19_05840 [Candidatus Bathyarchaeia archaeon]